MHKQVYDLSPVDLEEHPVWVFPMDDSVEDEASVRPVGDNEEVPSGLMRIARTRFRDGSGTILTGYVYLGGGDDVESTRPVVWAKEVSITVWNGMLEPDKEQLEEISRTGIVWPLRYEVDAQGVETLTGILTGVYYWDGSAVACKSL